MYLNKNNCDYMQGYLFSKPLGMKRAVDLLQGHKDKMAGEDD